MPTRSIQIGLDRAQFRRLVAGKSLIFKSDDLHVELRLAFEGVAWRQTLHAALGIGGDPPQAAEMLGNKFTRRPYK
jgi:hypothetical protein